MEQFFDKLTQINDAINGFVWVKIGLVLLILGIILFTKKRGGVSEAQAERARLRLETENDSAAIADEEEALSAFFSSYGLSTEKGKEEDFDRSHPDFTSMIDFDGIDVVNEEDIDV